MFSWSHSIRVVAAMSGDKGIESIKNFIKRNCDFCDMIFEEYKAKNILIVTHAANVRIINYYFSGKPKDYDFSRGVSENGGLLTFKI